MFLMMPVVNTIVRVQQEAADMYGLDAAGQADEFARAALHLSEYRKMEPGPLEEAIFDHPSGRTRIYSAMRWKADSSGDLDAALDRSGRRGRAGRHPGDGNAAAVTTREHPAARKLEPGC